MFISSVPVLVYVEYTIYFNILITIVMNYDKIIYYMH